MTRSAKALFSFLKKNSANLERSLKAKQDQIAKLQSKKQLTERDLQRLRNLRQEVKQIRQQIKTNNAKASNAPKSKPEPVTFESEKRKILRKAAMPGGHDKELIALAKKYRRTITIAGKTYAPPKEGPPTKSGRNPMKRGGSVKKMKRGGAVKKKK